MTNVRGKRRYQGIIEEASLLPSKRMSILLDIFSKDVSNKIIRLYKIYRNTKKFRIRKKLWKRIEKEYDKQPVRIIGIDLASGRDSSFRTTMRKNSDGLWEIENIERSIFNAFNCSEFL